MYDLPGDDIASDVLEDEACEGAFSSIILEINFIIQSGQLSVYKCIS